MLQTAAEKCSHLAKFRAGLYFQKQEKPKAKENKDQNGDKSELQPKMALKYARYAAFTARADENEHVQQFTPATASSVVYAHRMAEHYSDGLADYKALKELGIASASLENQAALCSLYLKYFEQALEEIRKAIQTHDEPVFRANLALIEVAADHRIDAHKTFLRLATDFPKYELPKVYAAPRALAAYAQHTADPKSVKKEELITILEEAAANPPPASLSWTKQEASLALAQLKNPADPGTAA